MKKTNSILFALLLTMCLPIFGQTPAYDDLTMESDEITETFRPAAKNHIFLRSKRGTSGLNKTSAGDSIKTFPVVEIVLVFTEVNESAFDEREDANRERWENLMKTYPEYFQANTLYKSLCQCKIGGDSVAFKKAQGFYVYYKGKAPKPAEPVVKVEEKKVEEPKVEEKKVEEKKVETKKTEEKIVETKKVEEKKIEDKKEVVKEVEKPVTKEKEIEKKKEEKVAVEETKPVEETNTVEEPVVKATPQKKAPVGKARRAKDPKACRPACYESGDDDLNAFFKSNLTFTKKERRHVKKLSPVVKIQLNVDGSIKKVTVTGEDEVLNKKVEGAVNGMNKWNAAVKNGVTVKSEVKITLKYDKDAKGLKPFEVVMVPRPGPKCKCVSDSEMFGD
jgi:hypothetical protein